MVRFVFSLDLTFLYLSSVFEDHIQVGTTLDLRVILAMFLGTFASVVGFCLVFIIINVVNSIIIITR